MSDVIEDGVFVNCVIHGPAMISLVGDCVLDGCGFDGTVESLLFELGSPRQVVGAIGLLRCQFVDCRFTRIGILGVPEALDDFRTALDAQAEAGPPPPE